MKFQDKAVILLRRPYRCNNCFLCPCVNQTLTVESPPGVEIGEVRQNFSMIRPAFEIADSQGEVVYRIEGEIKKTLLHWKTCVQNFDNFVSIFDLNFLLSCCTSMIPDRIH